MGNGFSKHITSVGHVYEGFFKGNKKHGRGKLTAPDGTWEEDERVQRDAV